MSYPEHPGYLAVIAWRPKHCFFSSKGRPEHPEAKLWHKNDDFDEKKVCGGPKRRPETAKLTSPRECMERPLPPHKYASVYIYMYMCVHM